MLDPIFKIRPTKSLFTKITVVASVVLFIGHAPAEHLSNRQRIIALSPHIVELLFAIGAGNQIIATSEFSNYPKQAKAIPRIGNYAQLQLERIVALNPDVIIAWRAGNPSPDLKKLEQLGLNIIDSSPRKLEDVASELIALGQLTGHDQNAKSIADAYLTQLSKLRTRYQNKQKVRVFYELWSRPLTTVANQAWLQQQLDVCQAENPFSQLVGDYPQVGLEQVLASQPGIVIQPNSPTNRNVDALDWELWSDIPAVKNDLIIRPDADQLHRMTPRMLDALKDLCQEIDRARPKR